MEKKPKKRGDLGKKKKKNTRAWRGLAEGGGTSIWQERAGEEQLRSRGDNTKSEQLHKILGSITGREIPILP